MFDADYDRFCPHCGEVVDCYLLISGEYCEHCGNNIYDEPEEIILEDE